MAVEVGYDGQGTPIQVGAGASVTFGRGSKEMGVDLFVGDNPMLHRLCGQLTVTDTGWDLVNLGSFCQLAVRDLDGPGLDVVTPRSRRHFSWRRAAIVFPFEADVKTVLVTDRRGAVRDGVVVFPTLSLSEPTQRPALARDSGYFRALVALCEPALVPPFSVDELPTDAEIAVRLNRCGAEQRHVTARGVQRRLDHVRSVLGLRENTAEGLAGLERRDARRQLARYAVRGGAVATDDLTIIGGAFSVDTE